MKTIFFFPLLIFLVVSTSGWSQTKGQGGNQLKVKVFYFHPSDRCPIDQSIEDNTKAVMQSYFLKETANGTILFKVMNTDDKANASVVSKFDINAQALYIVKVENGKETQKDLTRFAFDYGKSNPGKFKADLKAEIEKALKR
ncbi:MAG: nitrophenyl compound nitroreductase subunit ArsF family protein [Bacteroidales bacterium]|jgi:hypothetical protein